MTVFIFHTANFGLLFSAEADIMHGSDPGVAQLVGRLVWDQDAASSSLATRTKNAGMASCHPCIFLLTVRLEQSNAARMSAAGEGGAPRSESLIFMIAGGNHSIIHLTEPLLYLRTLPCADAFESRHSVRNRRFSVRNRRFSVSILSIQHLGSHQRHPLPLLYPIFQ